MGGTLICKRLQQFIISKIPVTHLELMKLSRWKVKCIQEETEVHLRFIQAFDDYQHMNDGESTPA